MDPEGTVAVFSVLYSTWEKKIAQCFVFLNQLPMFGELYLLLHICLVSGKMGNFKNVLLSFPGILWR